MSDPAGQLDVLMYHSISDGAGPTCIDPDTFRMQVDLLAEFGYQSVSLEQVAAWLRAGEPLPQRPVLLTFDDAFQDFADIAWPLLRQRGLGATVFVPTGRVAGADDWENGAGHAARRLMDWNQMRRLSAEGVEFGGHSVDHGDLTRLPEAELRRQVLACQQTLQAELGRPAVAFAPPYGCTTPAVRAVVSQFYQLSFGTALGQTRRGHDPWDLPRVEMHYFRSPARWRTHLEGGGAWWLSARRSLRAVRQVSERCWPFAVRVPTRAEA